MPDLLDYWPHESDWTSRLDSFFASETWDSLNQFVVNEAANNTVFPNLENVFRAFSIPGFANTKVVVLGQDPYHGPGQAHGLSFSVIDGMKIPPSLRNIFRELHDDLGVEIPDSGNLEPWANQGVFLLNTVLTVNQATANSHRKKGWEQFTDTVIKLLNEHPERLVFMLWGKPAEAKAKLLDPRHELIISAHPSPLSARRGFLGSRPFSRANRALTRFGRKPIDWSIR